MFTVGQTSVEETVLYKSLNDNQDLDLVSECIGVHGFKG